jgi:hypothetical protein
MKRADEPAVPADRSEAEDETGPEPSDAGANVGTDATDATPSPTRMLRIEQQVGWMLVAVMAAGVAGSWASDVIKGDSKAISLAAIGLGLTAVLAAAVWYGRRLIAAFAGMAAGLAPVKTGYVVVSFACLAYGGYLMFRNTFAQRKAAMARPRRPPRAARTRSGKAAAGAAAAAAADGARRPSANRRYTPPKAKNPRRGR